MRIVNGIGEAVSTAEIGQPLFAEVVLENDGISVNGNNSFQSEHLGQFYKIVPLVELRYWKSADSFRLLSIFRSINALTIALSIISIVCKIDS